MWHNCVLEFLGTLILVLMGDGVCAATTLKGCKAKGAGWVVIAFGWGLAVMCGVFVAHDSGAHLNPARAGRPVRLGRVHPLRHCPDAWRLLRRLPRVALL